MWVIQEVGLARKVLVTCGEQELDWEEFEIGTRATYFLSWHSAYGISPLYQSVFTIGSTRYDVRQNSNKDDLGLLPLLEDFRSFLATDPRDKVFALFSLTNTNLDELGFVPDYRSSPKDVYIQAAKFILQSCNSLGLLSCPRGSTEFSKILPSWVPDWSDSSKQPSSIFAHEEQGIPVSPFSAAGISALSSPIFGPGTCLTLSGHRMDVLKTLSGILPDTSYDFSVQQDKVDAVSPMGHGSRDAVRYLYSVLGNVSAQRDTLAAWDEMALGIKFKNAEATYAPAEETREVAYMRILTLDFVPEGLEFTLKTFRQWREERWDATFLRNAGIDRWPALHKGLSMTGLFLTYTNKPQPFQGMFAGAMLRRLCWTERGYLGLVPSEARLGDEVWLLKGCRVPLVLRRVGDGEDRELVGDSYIHGVMYGEAFEEERCEKVSMV
jgi:hypothetical protein